VGEISVAIPPETSGAAENGGASASTATTAAAAAASGDEGGGDVRASTGRHDNSTVDLSGISMRSNPESDRKARLIRMAHCDLEVTGAAAGAAGGDAAGKEFLIAVRIKAGARNFIRKTADDAGLCRLNQVDP
jgi:hypothetical protein